VNSVNKPIKENKKQEEKDANMMEISSVNL
jgi:hypothetical protein